MATAAPRHAAKWRATAVSMASGWGNLAAGPSTFATMASGCGSGLLTHPRRPPAPLTRWRGGAASPAGAELPGCREHQRGGGPCAAIPHHVSHGGAADALGLPPVAHARGRRHGHGGVPRHAPIVRAGGVGLLRRQEGEEKACCRCWQCREEEEVAASRPVDIPWEAGTSVIIVDSPESEEMDDAF
jgi:hypothetical protein